MALTPGTTVRTPGVGENFRTLDTGGVKVQGVGLMDGAGNHIAFDSASVTAGTAVDSAVIKASAGRLGDFLGILDPTSTLDRCIMLFNATSLPSNGTAPIWRVPVVGGSFAGWHFPQGKIFSTGIVIAFSSTWDDLTVTTGTEGYFQAEFV